ncbi:unnamed protein product [Symbiodinium natans]|uniref:Uncharacterized protein n=1 Tax=Symbiodinium natans TaxID=878477 RepID=A0A812LV79_9DINO|nr:unnamed protein product [Symbiodinium natans]CAE7275508.1 unnamed protein product [Symbiodinium natans]
MPITLLHEQPRLPGIQLHRNLLAAFLEIVGLYASPTATVQADVLLAFEVFSSARPRRHVVRQYAWLTAVSSRAGALKADQVFVLAEISEPFQFGAGPGRFDNMLLDLAFEKYVDCQKDYLPVPAGERRVGRLQTLLSDAFAFHLLSLFDDENMSPSTVVINKLLFQDISPKQVRVTGLDTSFQQAVVTVDGDAGQDDSEVAGEPLMEPGQPEEYDDARAGDGVDFLSLLDDGAGPDLPPTKRRRTRRTSVQPPGEEGDVQKNDILDDPQLQAILGPKQIAELKKAVEVCSAIEVPEQTWMSTRASADSDSDILEECHVDCDVEEQEHGAACSTRTSSAPASGSAASADVGRPGPSEPVSRAAAAGSSGVVHDWQLLSTEEDGSRVEVKYGGHGTTFCTVRRVFRGVVEELGAANLLVKHATGQESLRAVCRKHKKCECWISNTHHSDLLLQWLRVAHKESPDSHARLSLELRRSIGMKVRA